MSEEKPAPANVHLFHKKKPDWVRRVVWGGIAGLLLSIVILSLPVVLRPRHRSSADRTEAVHNARQIGVVLFEFEKAYGSFPSDDTSTLVTKANPEHGFVLSGKSSNALFLQLLSSNLTQNEAMFYAKVKNSRKPDGVVIAGEALKKAEVGFAYIPGLSSTVDPNTPILLSPLIPGTTQFDPETFRGYAVVLRTDNSVRSYKIEKDGRIYDKGIDLLSSRHPVWKGKKPDIRYPE